MRVVGRSAFLMVAVVPVASLLLLLVGGSEGFSTKQASFSPLQGSVQGAQLPKRSLTSSAAAARFLSFAPETTSSKSSSSSSLQAARDDSVDVEWSSEGDNEAENNSNQNNANLLRRSAKSCQQMAGKTRRWMKHVLLWQRSKSRSMLSAVALAFTVLLSAQQFTTMQQQSNYHPTASAASSGTEIHRSSSQFSSSSSTSMNPMDTGVSNWARGGSTAATSSPAKFWQRGGSKAGAAAAAVPTAPKMRLFQGGNNKDSEQGALEKMEESVATAGLSTSRTLMEAMADLGKYMEGTKSDTLLLLLATALITPLCKKLGTSPILGFLASGMLLGPNGFGLISGIHSTETLAELGIVFFLFEMGIELSMDRLMSMRKDVFGLGLSQFVVTALAVAGVGKVVGLPAPALVVLGGGLALSSSAFVLQLLKDKNQLATRFGKASFGILLFQDLAVVPLLVVTPILAGQGKGLAAALGSALVKAVLALGSIAFAGRVILNPLFKTVAQARSQEAFLGVILLTVLSMSFMTEGLGLSNTLGAFLAGVLLSETKYRYQVEADIAPFRGILLGLFFVTVGFEIDVGLIMSNLPLVSSIVFGILSIKAATTTALSLIFGLSLSTSLQTGLMLSQGGEFAFVAFGLARSLGILDTATTKLMLTSVSLTMALTPLMATLGSKIAKRLEEQSDFTHYLGQDRDANEIKESDDFVVVVGYGVVGKVVCDLLDRKFIKYVGLDIEPNKVITARNAGLPVFYGDIGRQEVADAFNVGKAKMVAVCISDKQQCNRVAIALRRFYPDLKIFARASDADHATRLQNTLNVAAMVPILPEDNLLLTLPFGSAVMKSLGVPAEEVNAITEAKRKEVLSGRGLEKDEEEIALLQLGVTRNVPKGATVVETVAKVDNDEDEKDSSRKKSAAERAGAAREKSPFVAQVIQEVCPSDDYDEPEKVEQFIKVPEDPVNDKETEIDPDMEEAQAIQSAAALKNETETPFQ
jgi:CPA2 family monovalent cation:H+ antiporter-2